VSDYYDRLETQLMEATARPWPRALRVPTRPSRPRRDLFALVAGLAITAAVAAIFIRLRPSARPAKRVLAPHRLAVVHNYVSGAVPPLGGAFSCESRLAPPQADPSKVPRPWSCYLTVGIATGAGPRQDPGLGGTVVVNVKPPSGMVFSIDASGLTPIPSAGDYAVWLLPGRSRGGSCGCPAIRYSLISRRRPAFLGIVTPPVGANGRLRVEGLMPTLSEQQATGAYLFVVTRQARPSNKSLGRVVLEGWLSF
jgi:hypothetical protein